MAKEKEAKTEDEVTNDIKKLTPHEKEMLGLRTQLQDLKDLYENVVKENTSITKLSNEYEAKVLELQSLLIDSKLETDENDEGLKEEIVELEKDLAVGQAVNEQLEEQIESYLGIIEKLIEA